MTFLPRADVERLTDWERGFVDSLRHQIESGRIPSAKQIEALDNISSTWLEDYDDASAKVKP